MKINLEKLREPELLFKNTTHTYCKEGLLTCEGPYAAKKESHSNKIILGLIGTKDMAEKTKEWVDLCNNFIESKPHGNKEVVDKNIFPDFPGAQYAFDTKLILENSYTSYISLADIVKLNPNNAFKYFDDLLKLVKEKVLEIISKNETRPNVILLTLSDEMYEKCYIVGDYHQQLKNRKPVNPNQLNLFSDLDHFGQPETDEEPLYLNFRSSLKKLMMSPEIKIPIQILREQTVKPDSEFTQNAATKAWNFCTGIYYKCGRHPWVLRDVDYDTCFLGISFFHKKDHYSDNLYTSMASLFSNDFEDIVLRGKQVDFDEALGMPYLDYEKSKFIVEQSLDVYKKLKPNKLPKRIVIHKTSEFLPEEIKGYCEPLEQNGIIYDLVSIRKASLRFIRFGKMPIPRGTYLSINDESHYLYTKGYVPELQTYPGVHVPAPFEVIKARGDSSHKELCKEILSLTKLNWNTADFCCGLPITIGFSKNVGQVMKNFSDSDIYAPEMSYRYYM